MTDGDRLERLLDALDARGSGARVQRHAVRVARAPGRVNLIGEHTDYNLGYVLPAAISLDTWIASVPRDDGRVVISSLQEDGEYEFDVADPGTPQGTWRDYIAGVATTLSTRGVATRAVTAVVDSNVPVGSGLSSSAALELAGAWTLSEAVPPPLPRMELAQAAQQAENEYVGVQCGLMDQFASSFGTAGCALLLDCRSLDHETVPLPSGLRLVAIDTRSPHKLGTSEYNARREQCERAAAALASRYPTVASLRDATPEMLSSASDLLDEETLRRCTHVVNENERVLLAVAALRAGDLESVGRLFTESHASLRDLYEVSSPDLDALVEIAAEVPGVIGARMTGGGFGGCTVNLVRDEAVDALCAKVRREFPERAGRDPGVYVVDAVSGAGVVL